MPNHRDQGHLLLHKFSIFMLCFCWFWLSLSAWESWGFSLISLPWNYALVAIAGLLVSSFGTFQNYGAFFIKNGWERIRDSFSKSNFQTAVIAFFVFGAYFATKDKETSRLFLGFFVLGTWPVLVLSNFALPGIFKRIIGFRGINRKTLIIGYHKSLDDLTGWMKNQESHGFSFVGSFTSTAEKPKHEKLPWLGHFVDLDQYLESNDVQQLVVVPDRKKEEWVAQVADLAAKHGCRILIFNSMSGLFDSRLVFVEESGRQFFTLLNEPLDSPFNQMLKRLFDLSISIPALLFAFPVLALLVKLFQSAQSAGPLFFKQERVGLGGKRFVIWKFRSMHFAPKGTRDESVQASLGDDRIFSFGRTMRRFSIDEVPQFINVLKGEMSLVGPRPYLAEHDYLFQRDYKAYRIRQFVKPGVTGPAQCRGLRGEFTDPELVNKRIEMDFNYVGNWSIWLDVEIVFRTIGQILFPPKSAC